jgi:signal transduction histidine kinase
MTVRRSSSAWCALARITAEARDVLGTSAAVDVRLEGQPGEGLSIEVRNPAPVLAAGATGIPGSGTGLVGLAERASLSGGRLEHGVDGQGDFRLRAWLPWLQ